MIEGTRLVRVNDEGQIYAGDDAESYLAYASPVGGLYKNATQVVKVTFDYLSLATGEKDNFVFQTIGSDDQYAGKGALCQLSRVQAYIMVRIMGVSVLN